MKKLPIKLQRLIKNKKFKLDTTTGTNSWRGGLKINYRITWIKVDNEEYYEDLTPLNTKNHALRVNIKVSGKVETATNRWDATTNYMVDIKKVAGKYKRNGWFYTDPYDSKWGHQAHKKVREEIRRTTKHQIKNYLKLMGITTTRWDGGIHVNTIGWE